MMISKSDMRRIFIASLLVLLNAVSVYGAVCRTDCANTVPGHKRMHIVRGNHPGCHGHAKTDNPSGSTGSGGCRREFCDNDLNSNAPESFKILRVSNIRPLWTAFLVPTRFASAQISFLPAILSDHHTDPPSLFYASTVVMTC